MADDRTQQSGGFHFGKVGGAVNLSAGGDIVGGNKTTTTTIQKGFRGEEQKQQFQAEVEQLRVALRTLKEQIARHPALTPDQKDEAESEILTHVTALKQVKEKTAAVPAGREAPPEIATTVQSTLERAGGVIDGLQRVAKKSIDVAETVGEFAQKFGPLLISARHLFGLP